MRVASHLFWPGNKTSEEAARVECHPFSFQATTTPLVRNIFEQFFLNQIDGKATSAPKRRRCGVCEVCGVCEMCGMCGVYGVCGMCVECVECVGCMECVECVRCLECVE